MEKIRPAIRTGTKARVVQSEISPSTPTMTGNHAVRNPGPDKDTEMAECPKATNKKTRMSRNIRKACLGISLWSARWDPNPEPTRVRSRQTGQHLKYHLGRPSFAAPEGLPTKMQGRCPLDVRSPPRWSGLGPGLLGARPPMLQCAPADPSPDLSIG